MTDPTHRYMLAIEIGEEAIRQGKWQQALTCFQTALSGLPREPRVYNGLGDTHRALADRVRALACYKEAARLAGDDPLYAGKVAAMQEELELLPDAVQSYLLAGELLWKNGAAAEAEAHWAAALRLQPDLVPARERLATACVQRGDTAGAVGHYLALAKKMRDEGRCLMALHICYTALSAAPDDPAVWAATEEAWRCVAARDQRPEAGDSPVDKGDLLSAAAEFAQWQLTAEIRRSALQTPETTGQERYVQLRQAMLNEGRGRAGLAIILYEKAIAAGLDSPAVFFALGLLYRLVQKPESGRAALRLAARHPFYRRAVALLE